MTTQTNLQFFMTMEEYRVILQRVLEKHDLRLLTRDGSRRTFEISAREVPDTFAQLRIALPGTPIRPEIFDLPAKAGVAVTFAPAETDRQLVPATVGAKGVWHKEEDWYHNETPIRIARLAQKEFLREMSGRAFFRRSGQSTLERTFIRYSAGALRRYEEGKVFSCTTSSDPSISYYVPDVTIGN